MASQQASVRSPRRGLLDVEIAVLDEHGVIAAVNAGWEQFGRRNGGDPARTGVGVSYLDVCEPANGDPSSMATAAAIRAALRGELTSSMSIVVPCNSPWRSRWFELFVSPRWGDDGRATGATVTLVPAARPIGRPTFDADQPVGDAHRVGDVHDSVIQHLFTAGLGLGALVHDAQPRGSPAAVEEILDHLDAAIDDLRRHSYRPGDPDLNHH